jgi:hypothetical protein
MNLSKGMPTAAMLILVLTLSFVTTRSVSAASSPAVSESQALHDAYATLSKADHDYKGHRMTAMRHIERACKLLGSPIKGDGKAGEAQGVSDDQLRAAQGILQNARSLAAANNQKQVLTQIDAALSELTTALSIK